MWFKSKPKEDPKKVETKPTAQNRELEYERVINNINMEVAKIEQQLDAKEGRMEKLDKEIRELVKMKKNTQAKTKVHELKMIREEMVTLDKKKFVMTKMKLQTEQSRSDASTTMVMKDVNILLKADEKVRDDLQDQILDWQEYQQGQEEMKNMWGQMAEGDDAEVEDELNKYITENDKIEADKVRAAMEGIPYANVQPNKNYATTQNKQQDLFNQSLLENEYKI